MAANVHPNSVEAQRARLLARLRSGPVSTLDARTELDVLHPAARVMELRGMGYHIETRWSREYSPCGQLHRVARYEMILPRDGASLPLPIRMMRCAKRRAS